METENGDLFVNETKGEVKYGSFSPPEGRKLAVICARLLDEMRLKEITVLQISDVLQIVDYFVIASGVSTRQLKRAGDYVGKRLKEVGISRSTVEGKNGSCWVLLDLGTVVLHLMSQEAREYYNLELLWGDCPKLEWEKEEE